jgi:hypothetical protein
MKEGKTTDKKLISGLFLMGIVLFISLSFFSRKQYLKTAEEDLTSFRSSAAECPSEAPASPVLDFSYL